MASSSALARLDAAFYQRWTSRCPGRRAISLPPAVDVQMPGAARHQSISPMSQKASVAESAETSMDAGKPTNTKSAALTYARP